jgi:hypothetical protein
VRPLDSGLEIPRQVTFAAGRLWTSIDTAIGPRGGPKRTGVLWLVIRPTFDGRQVGGQVTRQGYLAVDTNGRRPAAHWAASASALSPERASLLAPLRMPRRG